MKTNIGLISPGQMGAAVGACINNHRVIWAGADRSEASHQRATDAGIENCGDMEALCKQSEIILSICPPHDAETVATDVAKLGFSGLFVDCNAISPARSRRISALFDDSHYVDGGIVGGPPTSKESGTVLHLSGDNTDQVAALFADSHLSVNVISDQIGQASALKMAFAAYTKGSTALLTAILGVAEKEGVRNQLEKQWGESFTEQTHLRTVANSAKAWRFSGEMHEIADTFLSAGQPEGFHRAAAEVFDALVAFKNAPAADIEALLNVLTDESHD